MKIDLSDKVVLVTGASKGIGKALARGLATAGAKIAVHYNANQEQAQILTRQLGNAAVPFQANFDRPGDAALLVDQVISTFGRLDVVINNAGIAIHSSIDKPDAEWIEDWEKTFRVNLTATSVICKKALEYFVGINSGIIINISSRAAFRGDTQDYLAYASSKAGMVALTRSIARAYGKRNITAFTVAPGFTKTDMAKEFMDEYGEDFAKNDIALPDLTTPDDLVPLVVFLSSGLAKHATGATIDVNAGSYVH